MPLMFSAWTREVMAILKKELLQDKRNPSQWLTPLLYALVVVAILSFSTLGLDLKRQPELAAGLVTVGLVFGAFAAIPRLFTQESELRTLEILQLSARPEAVYWGKQLYGFFQLSAFALFLVPTFIIFSGSAVVNVGLLTITLLLSQAVLVGAVTLTSALVAESDARGNIGVAIAAPLVFPVFTVQTSAMAYAFGRPGASGVQNTLWALLVAASVLVLMGPLLYAMLWKHYRK